MCIVSIIKMESTSTTMENSASCTPIENDDIRFMLNQWLDRKDAMLDALKKQSTENAEQHQKKIE